MENEQNKPMSREKVENLIKTAFVLDDFSIERVLEKIDYEEIELRPDNRMIDTDKGKYGKIILGAIVEELKHIQQEILLEIKKIHVTNDFYQNLVHYSQINDPNLQNINAINSYKHPNIIPLIDKLQNIEYLLSQTEPRLK